MNAEVNDSMIPTIDVWPTHYMDKPPHHVDFQDIATKVKAMLCPCNYTHELILKEENDFFKGRILVDSYFFITHTISVFSVCQPILSAP